MRVRVRVRRGRSVAGAAGLVVVAMLAGACGSTSTAADAPAASTTAATTQATVGTTTTARSATTSSGAAASGDEALVARALLTPQDAPGDGWGTIMDSMTFPNSAALARTLPACAPFSELVFDGGAAHGRGRSGVITKYGGLLFLYDVVFPTEQGAIAMLDAVATAEFDQCWAAFNGAAVPAMPINVVAASYDVSPPPSLALHADAVSVKFLQGQTTQKNRQRSYPDTCVCVFARVGRGVVEVHSNEPMLTLEQRTAVVQAAIDKMRTNLA